MSVPCPGGGSPTVLVTTVIRSEWETEQTLDAACLVLVLDGFFEETYGRSTFRRRPGTMHYHPAGLWSRATIPSGAKCFGVVYPKAFFISAEVQDSPIGAHGDLAIPELMAQVQSLRAGFSSKDPLRMLAMQGLALESFATLFDPARTPSGRTAPRWLRRVRESVIEDPVGVDLGRLAAEAGVHPSHLARCFKKMYGQTIGDCARQRRFELAYLLLSASKQPLGEIALSCGYADQAHLSRDVRSRAGMTPGDIRHKG